jgi:polyphosphate kinase
MDERTSSWWLDETGQWTRHDVDERGVHLDDMQNKLMRQISARKRPTGRR